MQHLDDGTLQAWLDRARSELGGYEIEAIEHHLDRCQDCSARAKALERLDDRISALLAGSGSPAGDPPSYSEVVRRADELGRARRGRGRWTAQAWVASVVVAIGVGWLTNDLHRASLAPNGGAGAPDQGAPSGQRPLPIGRDVEAPSVAPLADAPRAARVEGEVAQAPPGAPPTEALSPVGATPPSSPAPPSAAPQSRAAGAVAAGGTNAADSAPSSVPSRPSNPHVRGRVVDARTGEPIPAAQVFIADLDIGVLSRQDGSFDLPLVEADVSGGPLTLAVERIGYRRDSSDVAARPGETVAVEFRLSKEALQLDEVIVLGSAAGTQRRASGSAVLGRAAVSVVSAGDPALLGEDGWRRATRPEAEAAMGFAIATSPDLGVVEIELGAIGGIRAVRVRQALLSGGTLTLIETATDVSVVGSATFDDLPVAVVRRRGVVIIGSAPLTPAALEAELERIP